MDWPDDVDGDVLRGLEAEGFDFNKVVEIDFNIDFDKWPLSEETLKIITETYPGCEVIDPDEEDIENGDILGYVQFQVTDKLSYELVMDTQASVTEKMTPLGGYCDSWGLMS